MCCRIYRLLGASPLFRTHPNIRPAPPAASNVAAKVLDRWFASFFRPGDGHDVEAGWIVQQAVPLQIHKRHPRQAVLLVPVDSVRRMARGMRRAGLHFDEHDHAAIDSDDVDLTAAHVAAPFDDRVAEPLEMPCRGSLTALAKRFGPQDFRPQRLRQRRVSPPRCYMGRPPHAGAFAFNRVPGTLLAM